jgi:predicted Zn-dependent protease
LTKTLLALLLALPACAALAMATPPQPAPKTVPQTAPQPAPSTPVPAAVPEQPAEQLLRALLSGKTSAAEERRIGERIAGNFLGAVKLVPDPALQRYVNLVGTWVALQGERPDLAWRFGVVDSEDINAFAAPGGYIFVTKGLYRRLANEAELAGVLGHEIGHVIRKHQLKVVQKSQYIAAAAVLLGKQLKDEKQLIQNLIGNGAEIMSRSLDKEAEFEADRVGMVLAARAGYDAYALPTVLEEIGHVSDKDSRVALLFKTHPHPNDRFERLAEAVGDRLDGLAEGKNLGQRFHRLP